MIKEKLCYTAYDIEQELKLAHETTVLVQSYQVCVMQGLMVHPLALIYCLKTFNEILFF